MDKRPKKKKNSMINFQIKNIEKPPDSDKHSKRKGSQSNW